MASFSDFTVNLTTRTVTHNPTGMVWTVKKLKSGAVDIICRDTSPGVKAGMNYDQIMAVNRAASEAYVEHVRKSK